MASGARLLAATPTRLEKRPGFDLAAGVPICIRSKQLSSG